jgi:signal transduction histidine kinase
MTVLTLPFLLTTVTYLILGCWIILKQKNFVQQLYGVLCVMTCFWQGIWAALFANIPTNQLIGWVKFGYSGIVFIPAVFYHFIIEFTGKESRRWMLLGTYLASLGLLILIWTGSIFIDGLRKYEWGLSANAGVGHPLFGLLIGFVVVRMFLLLIALKKDSNTPALKKRQTNWVIAALILYSVGALDLLSNYGFSVFPLSCFFTGVAFLLFAYAIFRYELLAISAQNENAVEKIRRLAATQEMKNLGMTTAFPLVSQGELLGYLLLGEKMSEESYSKEDLLLLRIVANQAALGYQRVRYLEMAVRGARTEMLGEIAGGFAHEIKTPLANISLPAELCFIDLTDVEQGKRKFEEVLPDLKQRMKDIMQQTFKASDKIEAIRQFSKPGQVKLEPVDILKVINSSIALLDHTLNKYATKLRTEFPVRVPMIRGNAKQLEIVFVNLVKNAAEAMASSSTAAFARNLSLTCKDDGNFIVVSVKDSGPGIKRTDIGHLFEAYFTTKGSGGTGVGLFLSHQVIKAHGGSIEVHSEEGKGTEFLVRLPKFVNDNRAGINEAA